MLDLGLEKERLGYERKEGLSLKEERKTRVSKKGGLEFKRKKGRLWGWDKMKANK